MLGPEGSPYEKGTFRVEVTLSDRYPFTPPLVQFLTQVYHPNIDPNGRVCLGALKPKPSGTWSVIMNIPIILGAIRILLAEPNLSDPLMSDIAKEFLENYPIYRTKAEEATLKHAVKKGGRLSSSATFAAVGSGDESSKTGNDLQLQPEVDTNTNVANQEGQRKREVKDEPKSNANKSEREGQNTKIDVDDASQLSVSAFLAAAGEDDRREMEKKLHMPAKETMPEPDPGPAVKRARLDLDGHGRSGNGTSGSAGTSAATATRGQNRKEDDRKIQLLKPTKESDSDSDDIFF